ncbi:MAG: hypothetical protein IJG36_05205 [Synergistaceae bacterium]|nr:hypothetical protein [Synergistaceae bacterium]
MSGFTKGKWIYYPPSENDIREGLENYDILSIQERTGHFRKIGHCIGTTYTEANARLIVAAPEMYELLKVWTQIQAQPTLMNAQENARKLLSCIDGKEE